MKPGRTKGGKSNLTPRMEKEIFRRLAEGSTLTALCKDPEMPSISTIMAWFRKDDELYQAYLISRSVRAEKMAEELLEIADNTEGDFRERRGRDGRMELVPDNKNVQRAKLQCETRRWIMEHLAPKNWGAKVQVSGDENAPIKHQHEIKPDMDPKEAAEAYKAFMNGT